MKKLLVLAFVCLLAQAAYAADPFKVHEAGFGPKLHGLQLGMPMTWSKMISAALEYQNLPTMFIADNYNDVVPEYLEQQEESPDRSRKSISISFPMSEGTVFPEVTGGSDNVLPYIPKKDKLDNLFTYLKDNSMNYASMSGIGEGGNIIVLRNERVIHYSFDREVLSWRVLGRPASAAEIAEWLSKTYSLETMEQKGKGYELRNPSEGWRVLVSDDKVAVFSMPMNE